MKRIVAAIMLIAFGLLSGCSNTSSAAGNARGVTEEATGGGIEETSNSIEVDTSGGDAEETLDGVTAEQLVGVWRQEDYWDLRNHNETAYEAVFTEDGKMYLTAYKFVPDAGEITETLKCGYNVENGALRLLEDAADDNLDDMVTELSARSDNIVLTVQDERKKSRIELIKTTEEIPKLYTVQP